MNSWLDAIKRYKPSFFTQMILVFTLIEVLLFIATQSYPDVISRELVLYLGILMGFMAFISAVVQVLFSISEAYEMYAIASLKYFKSITAGIAGGLIVYATNSYEVGSLSSIPAMVGEAFSLSVIVLIILLVLAVGLIGFIFIEEKHREKIQEQQNADAAR